MTSSAGSWLRCVAACTAFGLFPAAAQAPGDLRLALVIGNAAYAGNAALANPVNDARAMAETLKGMGFTVIEVRDGDRARIIGAIAEAGERLRGRQAIGMLYYAGHGVQVDWRNYMVPVDANLKTAADVAQQGVDVARVLDMFKSSGNRMNIVVLDACRDNPFESTPSAKGLAQVDAPSGTFLAYATAPGNVAEDGAVVAGQTGNGLYTRFLLQEMRRPAARIEEVFKRVRFNVRQNSQGRQIPWESTSLEEEFSFDTGKPVAPAPDAREKLFAEQKNEWDKVRNTTDTKDLYAFLERYPSSEVSELALSRLNQLTKPLVVAAPAKGQSETLAYAGAKFREGDVFTYRITDLFSGGTRQQVRAVKSVVDGIATVHYDNGTVARFDALGGTIDMVSNGRTTVFDPPQEPNPAEVLPGKKWDGASTFMADGRKVTTYSSFKIVGNERITLPSGTFDTYVVDVILMTNGATQRVRKWVDPRYGFSLKREIVERQGSTITVNERREIVAMKAERPVN